MKKEHFQKIEELLRAEDQSSGLLGRQMIRNHRAEKDLPALEVGKTYNIVWVSGQYKPNLQSMDKMTFSHMVCDPSTHWNKVAYFTDARGQLHIFTQSSLLDLTVRKS